MEKTKKTKQKETKSEPTGLRKNWADFMAEEKSDAAKINRHGLSVLYQKELSDHINSTRCQILYALLAIVCFIALYGAEQTLGASAQQTSDGQTTVSDFMFLLLFTTSGSSIYSISTFLGFLGPVFGIMLGFDAINEEMAQGTLNRLAAQPIWRDTIINAKFLAGATFVLISVFSIGGFVTGIGMIGTGLVPSGEEVARILIYLLMTSIYICIWMALAELFSVLCRHAATSALSCIAIWLFLTMFMSLLASGIAGFFYPVGNTMRGQMNVLSNYQLQVGLNRISPYYLFSEITTIIMNPNVRSTNVVAILQSSDSAIASYLTLGQSMLQIVPHIVVMIAEAVVFFAAAYISFMRREIRA